MEVVTFVHLYIWLTSLKEAQTDVSLPASWAEVVEPLISAAEAVQHPRAKEKDNGELCSRRMATHLSDGLHLRSLDPLWSSTLRWVMGRQGRPNDGLDIAPHIKHCYSWGSTGPAKTLLQQNIDLHVMYTEGSCLQNRHSVTILIN